MIRKLISLLVLFTSISCSGKSIPTRPDGLGRESVEFSIPEVERWELSNGLVVVYKYNDELPFMGGSLYVPGGSAYESTRLTGLAAAVGKQMRDGSIQGMKPAELDERLHALAASIESGYGSDRGSIGFSCLEEDFEEVFGLFSKVVRKPAFNERRLSLWKKLTLENIRRRRDNPNTMSDMTFNLLVFGEGSPYGRWGTSESVGRISRKLMYKFHRRYVRPNGAYLAISGSVPRAEVEKIIEKYFGDWPKNETPIPPLPEVTTGLAKGMYVLEREFDQATILLGHQGPARFTPDFHEIQLYNRVFGHGGFGSTLFSEIRTKEGLAYSVYGGIYTGTKAGTFEVYMRTRVSEAARAISRTIELIDESTNEAPLADRFNESKSAAERSFVFRFPNPSAIVRRRAEQEILKFPKDYDQTYLTRMSQITAQGVQAAGKRWVNSQGLYIVVVGRVSAAELAEQFADRMPVYRVSFTDEPKIEDVVQR